MKQFKRTTVTAALPYANGPLHIGHIAGAYLPADIYVRYLRLRKEDVVFICGSDEHGVAITLGAKKAGLPPKQFVDKYHEMMKKSFEDFGISFSIYSRTSSPVHYKVAQEEFFLPIYEQGIFLEETSDQYFDEQENIFLADRYIVGTCPNCGNPNAYGDQCERCGTSLSPRQLINPRSTVSGKAPVLKPTKHWYFPLDKYEAWLREWLVEGHATDWKTNVYGQCKSWIDQGLQPRSITRDLDWGIPVPLPDAKGKVLYVWFDAPIGYVSATKELLPDTWEKYWKDPETRLIHFIGKDNIVFHCIIFPAMLKAAGYILPDNVPANEFLNLEGEKISTSRNHAVWLHEYLADFPGRRDELRYVLTSISPETKDADFTWKDYQQKVNSELVAILGNFVNRVMVLTWKYFNGVVPSAKEITPASDARKKVLAAYRQAHTDLDAAARELTACLKTFRFREAQFQMMQLARVGNKFLADTEPWKLAKDDLEAVGAILNYALTVTGNLAIACEPFIPDAAKSIRKQLNSAGVDQDWSSFWKKEALIEPLPEGHTLAQPELLFRNVEDAEIEKQTEKLRKTPSPAATGDSHSPEPLKPEVVYDDFAKLDLRVGTVLSAERMEKSDKLLRLVVDTGLDQRTILSGIAKHYAPEDLVGKQVTIVANLAPRKMMGILSQGMILMAEDAAGKLRLLQPSETVQPGSKVS